MRLSQLKRRLENGEHPEDFARIIGGGCFRVAYRTGNWVIKSAKQRKPGPMPVRMMRKAGFQPPEQHRVGKWLIQPFYKRPTVKMRLQIREELTVNLSWYHLDAHEHNVGVDRYGRMVLFDY